VDRKPTSNQKLIDTAGSVGNGLVRCSLPIWGRDAHRPSGWFSRPFRAPCLPEFFALWEKRGLQYSLPEISARRICKLK